MAIGSSDMGSDPKSPLANYVTGVDVKGVSASDGHTNSEVEKAPKKKTAAKKAADK
jgi:hypothetical protein